MKITPTQKAQIKKLAQKHHLRLVLLFGSQVEAGGKYLHKFSDIDIAILPGKKLGLMEEARININLMSIFKTQKLDLVNLKNAGPLLMYQIFKNHQALFKESENTLTDYEIYAYQRNLEAKSLYELSHELLDKQIKKFKKELSYA